MCTQSLSWAELSFGAPSLRLVFPSQTLVLMRLSFRLLSPRPPVRAPTPSGCVFCVLASPEPSLQQHAVTPCPAPQALPLLIK